MIGGGATGAGVAVDAASRGYACCCSSTATSARARRAAARSSCTAACATSSRATSRSSWKRSKERGILRQNAPHLVSNLPFVVPNYDWWETPFYGLGLKLYNLLAGKYGFGESSILSRDETLQRLPTIRTDGLRGGVVYYDGQFDDSRLLINLLQTAAEHGAAHAQLRAGHRPDEGQRRHGRRGRRRAIWNPASSCRARARVVINAGGPFADGVRRLADPDGGRAHRAEPGHSPRIRSIVPAGRKRDHGAHTRRTGA